MLWKTIEILDRISVIKKYIIWIVGLIILFLIIISIVSFLKKRYVTFSVSLIPLLWIILDIYRFMNTPK